MPQKRFSLEAQPNRLPQPPVPQSLMTGFVLCPLAQLPPMSTQQLMLQQMLYHQAFQEAQAVCRPSILERDLLAVWN